MVSSFQSRLELSLKIRALMILRLLVVTILFGMAFLISINRRFEFTPYYLVILIYVISIVWALLLNRLKNLFLFALIQICFDVIFITGILYFTNGIQSPLMFVYFFPIIAASIILYTLPTFMVATLSVMSLGGIAYMSYRDIIPVSTFIASQTIFPETYSLLYIYLAYVFAFYLVAFLSVNLSERLRRVANELAEKRSDLIELKIFSDNILQSMNDGLIITDMTGNILTVNKAALELIGQQRYSTSANIRLLFPKHPARELIDRIEMESRRIYRFEDQYLKDDDQVLMFGFSASLLKNNEGTDVGIILLMQDLTEIKQMEGNLRRADRLAAIGEMAAGMAHEIRNPLSSIRGSVEMLREESRFEGSNNRLLNIVLRESDRLNELITGFLTFARPSPLKLQECDINSILKETVYLLRNQVDVKEKIDIQTDFRRQSIKVYADPQQIKQVFWNLCLNAIQSLENGTGNVRLLSDTVQYTDQTFARMTYMKDREMLPGAYARISVEDNGRGISEEHLRGLFSPFYTTKDHGLGLGLAIAYRIVKNHYGDIEVSSVPNKGSVFVVLLPMFRVHKEAEDS